MKKGVLVVSSITCISAMLYLCLHKVPVNEVYVNSSNTSVQIINLDKSVERKERYEAMLQEQQSSSPLFQDIKKLKIRATYGKTDINFYDITNENQPKQVEIGDLKQNTDYKVEDNKDGFSFVYNFHPEDSVIKRSRTRHMSIGEFGCLMSHLRAIQNVSKGDKDYGLIFEDDFVLLSPDFEPTLNKTLAKAPKDFCIIKLDTKTNFLSKAYSLVRFGRSNDFSNMIGNNIIGSSAYTSGYLITKKCAKQIVSLLEKEKINGREGAADLFLYRVLTEKYGYKNIWFTKTAMVRQNGADSDIWDTKYKQPNK